MPSTAQDFGRSGQEVQAVVLEVLVDQRQENLEETAQKMKNIKAGLSLKSVFFSKMYSGTFN